MATRGSVAPRSGGGKPSSKTPAPHKGKTAAKRTAEPARKPVARKAATRSGPAQRTPPCRTRSAPRKAPARGPAKRRSPRPRRTGPGLPVRILRALWRGLWKVTTATVTLLAKGVGAAARVIGHGARDLDPAHRRDGAGLGAIAAGLVIGYGVWWHGSSAVANGVA